MISLDIRGASSLAGDPRAGSSPLLRWKKVDGGRAICHSAHTRPSRRGECYFSAGKQSQRVPIVGQKPFCQGKTPERPDEDPNGKQTEQGKQKKRERPHVGSPQATPNQRNTKNQGNPSLGSPPRAKNPKQARETLLNLEEKEHRVVEDRRRRTRHP